MNSKATTCPPTDTLSDFAEGKLEPPTLDECELHISQCPACLETLRGLGTEDTLTAHVAAAMNEPSASGSSVQLDNLLERLLVQPTQDFRGSSRNPSSPVPAEMMADRAAEVLRCLEPGDDTSLGALGDYDLERLIGTGSSGVVFQATDRVLHRTVALKVLRPSLGEMARQRFHQRGPLDGGDRTSQCSDDLSSRPRGPAGIYGDAMDPGSITGTTFGRRKSV